MLTPEQIKGRIKNIAEKKRSAPTRGSADVFI